MNEPRLNEEYLYRELGVDMAPNKLKIPAQIQLNSGLVAQHGPYIGPYGIAVYCALCLFAQCRPQLHPSVRAIASMVGICERQVRRSLDVLIERQLIERSRRKSPVDGGNITNVYTIKAVKHD